MLDDKSRVTAISVSPDLPELGSLEHWVGRDFRNFLTTESRTKFDARLAEMRADPDALPRPIEMNHRDNANWEFPVRYTLHREPDSGGVLLLGRDMQPLAEIQQRLVREQMARERELEKFRGIETCYRVVLEASETPLVLVEPDQGRIRDINSAGRSCSAPSGTCWRAMHSRRPSRGSAGAGSWTSCVLLRPRTRSQGSRLLRGAMGVWCN